VTGLCTRGSGWSGRPEACSVGRPLRTPFMVPAPGGASRSFVPACASRRALHLALIRCLREGRSVDRCAANGRPSGATADERWAGKCRYAICIKRLSKRRKLVTVTKIVVEGFRMDEDGLVFRTRPRAGQIRRGNCDCPDGRFTKFAAEQRRDLILLLDDRHGARSTIVANQLLVDQRYEIRPSRSLN
jgi:hypothetical protein